MRQPWWCLKLDDGWEQREFSATVQIERLKKTPFILRVFLIGVL